MRSIIAFFIRFSIMFTVTSSTYFIFNYFLKEEKLSGEVFLQCSGLALIFTVLLILLDHLSTKLKLLASNHFIWIQYLILSAVIILWAQYFNWGNWDSPSYIILFLLSFTIIYIFVYFFIECSNKEQDLEINKHLMNYKKNNL